jgi:3-oxoacyl-[acyl-carrier-protein] synthase-3
MAALGNAELTKNDIDLLLVSTQSADFCVPSVGSKIHYCLGLKSDCNVVDINQGCNATANLLELALNHLYATASKHCLIIVGDLSTRHVQTSSGAEKALFGDSVSAVVLSSGSGYISNKIVYESSGYESIMLPQSNSAGKYYQKGGSLRLDGDAVYTFAVNSTLPVIEDALKANQFDIDDIDVFSFHQANKAINSSIINRLSIDPSKVYSSISQCGNTSSGSIFLNLALAELPKTGMFLLCGFGVGLSVGVTIINQNHPINNSIIKV